MARRSRPAPRSGESQGSIELHRSEQWIGPLPPPAALDAFEQIAPGTAAKIVDEFQAEAAHRRHRENRRDRAVFIETFIGQASAIVFALGGLGVATFAAVHDAQWIGSIIGGGVIVSGIVALRTGRGRKD